MAYNLPVTPVVIWEVIQVPVLAHTVLGVLLVVYMVIVVNEFFLV